MKQVDFFRCPRCGVDLESECREEAGRVKLGDVRVRVSPGLIPSASVVLAEKLRALADGIEQGRFDAPDGAMVLLVDSVKKHLDYGNRFGLNDAWWAVAAKRLAVEFKV